MSESNQPYVIFTFVAGMLLTVCVAVLAVFIASQRPNVVIVPSGGGAPASGAPSVTGGTLSAGAPAGSLALEDEPLPEGPPTLRVAKAQTLPMADDPFDPRWDAAVSVMIPVQAQNVTEPMLSNVTIREVELRALHDGQTIAWRVAWDAEQPADRVESAQFSDGVALQFPLVEDAPFMMGAVGQPVRILHWKAVWQHDVDHGFADVQDLYPNMWYDLYWFTEGDRPYTVNGAFDDPRAAPWFIAQQAGNPMANLDRSVPVEEAVAEGFGSLTTLPESHARARGAWRSGRWAVTFFRPIGLGDELSQLLAPGRTTSVALAVWNGSDQNVGARKHHSLWIPVEVQP
ncbi:MAG: hypothetical protein IT445_17230 [Phycisphaeraceae bacterium]|nr:hypothetical protein [Phycisphaeraceae bacterium]